jgi:hypothetical protein
MVTNGLSLGKKVVEDELPFRKDQQEKKFQNNAILVEVDSTSFKKRTAYMSLTLRVNNT